jgi:poly-gamma-glutamate synthesis protein (capsule biosynthesis protein)
MSLKLFACGDIVNSKSKKDFCDENLKNIIKNSDISICNFEAPIYTKDIQPIPKAGPHVYQTKESVKYLKQNGFNIVSLANNHIYDYGQSALKNTINELDKNSIDYIGAGINFDTAYTAKIIEKNGIKIGLLAGCENEFGCLYEDQNRGGYAWIFHSLIEDNIRKLKQEADSVVLIVHAGVEEIDFPIKEWRDRYKRLCDVGVDVVIGHHPHVPQGYEKYNESQIFYSLGNFYFDTVGFENKSDDSYSVVLEFEKDGLKDFKIIYHKKIYGQICLLKSNEVSFSIDKLNSYLGNNYLKRNDEICLKLFNKYYYSYYEGALGKLVTNTTILKKIKYLIKLLTGRRVKNNILLLHNIKIDSHRFVVIRALELKSKMRFEK